MVINRNNIEAYMLDYLEGNLDPLLTADLMAFLAEHPEFEKCLPDFDPHALQVDNKIFLYKESLRKDFADIPDINVANFEEFCIAYCEGLLEEPQIKILLYYIYNDPSRQKTLNSYRLTRLVPDHSIVFTCKSTLKKPVAGVSKMRYLVYGLSVAASVAALVLLMMPGPNDTQNTPMAQNKILPIVNQDQKIAPVQTGVKNAEIVLQQLAHAPDKKTIENKVFAEIRENTGIIQEKPEMQSLTPIAMNIIRPEDNSFPLNVPQMSLTKEKDAEIIVKNKMPSDGPAVESMFGSLIAKVDLWKTVSTAIIGFNHLTESQLSISRTLDENGNLTSLVLNTERYSITGNKKQ